jgi:hypothetical protein
MRFDPLANFFINQAIMRKVSLFVILILIGTFTSICIGQTEKQNKISLSFTAGPSLPVFSYSKHNGTNSAIWIGSWIEGFSKAKSGFAKTGFEYHLSADYKINSFLKFILLCGSYSNSLATQEMSDYLTLSNSNKEIKAEEGKYKYYYFTTGLGYYYSIKKIEINFNLFGGFGISQYPYYKFILLYTNVNPPIEFEHVGPKPNLKSFICGSSLSASYKISKTLNFGINIQYQMASYPYNVYPQSVPGGSPHQFDFSDKLKVRVINIGPKIEFCF